MGPVFWLATRASDLTASPRLGNSRVRRLAHLDMGKRVNWCDALASVLDSDGRKKQGPIFVIEDAAKSIDLVRHARQEPVPSVSRKGDVV
jgi:hypothetical protein